MIDCPGHSTNMIQEKRTHPSMVATQFKNRVLLLDNQTSGGFFRALEWCQQNIANRYHYDMEFFVTPDDEGATMFSFAKKEDAVAFKLAIF